MGGLIITHLGYTGLFWVDGVTCAIAGLLILNVLNPKKAKVFEEEEVENPKSPYKDGLFWIFFVAMSLFGIVFLQYFSTIPLFYKDVHALTEFQIGVIMGFNGGLIFILEMPLIKWIERQSFSMAGLMFIGAVLTGLSIVVLNLTGWVGIIVVGMLLMTIGEMIAFPFSNAFAMERSKRGNKGAYMAMYSISFSVSHIFGHNFGMQMIEKYGYSMTWYFVSFLALLCMILLFILKVKLKNGEVEAKELAIE
jgi:predicted MFS family arabinose efflux permease